MPRPKQSRKIQIPPRAKGFIPMAYYANASEPVLLRLEEYEAIRLLDYESMSQEEAAKLMEVSRPTLTRIYLEARKKVALTLTEARQLLIEGGEAIFEGDWYVCSSCKSYFNNPEQKQVDHCPLCLNNETDKMGD